MNQALINFFLSRCCHVGIGEPIKCTSLSLKDGELLIGGSRRCFVNGVLSGEYTSTGDIAEERGGEYFITGRTDDQVKVNGIRCNLSSISEQVASLKGVTFAQFLLYKGKFLVLFATSASPLESSLREVLPDAFYPSKVIYLDSVPVNSSGKADRSQLIATLEKECSIQMNSFTSALNFLQKFGITSTADLSSHSFVDYGRLPEGDHVVAASHSGLVVCIRIKDGFCRWQLATLFFHSLLIPGGFDGCIYFLSVFTGSVEWKFATDDVVKAACATYGCWYCLRAVVRQKAVQTEQRAQKLLLVLHDPKRFSSEARHLG
ncbi:hypothetical protein COOONC_09824 [Cooperia oncophora]